MKLTTIIVLNKKQLAEELSLLAVKFCSEKLLHCYLSGPLFNIGYAGGVVAFDCSEMKKVKDLRNYALTALEIFAEKCTSTKILSSIQ